MPHHRVQKIPTDVVLESQRSAGTILGRNWLQSCGAGRQEWPLDAVLLFLIASSLHTLSGRLSKSTAARVSGTFRIRC